MRSALKLACLLLAYSAVSCGRDDLDPPDGTRAQLRECRHDIPEELTFSTDGQDQRVVTPPGFGGLGLYANVPELHDCQRFLNPGGMSYDSLFAVYRLPTSTPIALVIAWNAYPQLGIQVGFNCLFLQRVASLNPPPGGRWSAVMVSYGTTWPDCSDPESEPRSHPGATLLQVSDTTYDGLNSPDDYPLVARWDRDRASGQHYVGLSCGTAWCEVGTGVVRSPTFATRMGGNAPSTPGRRRVTTSKGWYDEQVLAEPQTGGQRPSRLLGTFIPVPDLAQRDSADYHGTWVQVAWISLEPLPGSGPDPSNPYLDKANLELTAPTAGLDGLNRVFLCVGSMQECGVPANSPSDCEKIDGTPSDGLWWGRTTNPSGNNAFECITRYRFPAGFTVPGTARWRWIVHDEGRWFRCPEGCCEMIGEQ